MPNPLRDVSKEAGSAADSEDSWEQAGHRILLNEFQKRIQTGEISPERARILKPILEELGQVIGENPEEISDKMSHVDRFRELMGRMTNIVVVPSDKIPAPKEGSRGAHVNHLLQDAKRFLMIEGRRPHMGDKEGEMARRLFMRCALLRKEIHSAWEDEHQTLTIEREIARKWAMDIRTYGLRYHLMLANPIWPSPSVDQDPNAVFFSGGEKIREAVASACVQRGMDLLQGREGHNYAQSRWNQLRRCNVAVFDFSAKSVSNEAEVAYEMGIALAIGRSVVIAAPEQRKLPFDVDIEPVRYEDDIDATLIGDAIDKAAYGQQRGGTDSSLDETVAYAEWRFGSGDRLVRLTLDMLKKASKDPIQGRTLLENIIGFAGPESPILLRPSWPGSYPAPDRRRCFHVMPFGQGWSNKVMGLAASVCKQYECEYRRGDKVVDARIIRSIWDEICQASHVLVDLTGFNANVALELGMAHALGRNTLIMAQGGTVEELFNSVAKVRVYSYDISNEVGFNSVLDGFLS